MTAEGGVTAAPPGRTVLRVLQVFTVDQSLIFVTGQTDYLARHGVEVVLAAAAGPNARRLRDQGVETHAVSFTRAWSVRADVRAFRELSSLIRRVRPHIVHASTPKAGLISMLAAVTAGVPVRIYHMRGLPYLSESGVRRHILRGAERVACATAHRVICVSRSLRERAVRDRILTAGRAVVLGNGSGNGVDCFGRFDPHRLSPAVAAAHRARLGIPDDAFVFGFIGRFARSKGIVELHDAWRLLGPRAPRAHLVLVGQPDEREPAPEAEWLRRLPRVHCVEPTARIEEWHAVFNALVLPTWREGLSNVLLEAGAMGKPAIASSVVGCVDVVVSGETGLLVPPRDAAALAAAMTACCEDPALAQGYGTAARTRITRMFAPETVWEPLLQLYVEMTNAAAAMWGSSAGKRGLDVVIALVALVMTSPLAVAAAAAILLRMGRPVLFRQQRPGLNGAPFELLKFRTMAPQALTAARPDAERLTRLGRLLRRTSIDEIPQLWNVLRGDMSLVGPRPLLMEYLPLYSAQQMRRHEVRPGVTGWAQVRGRNALSWGARFELDVWYVDHASLLLDLRILARTMAVVLTSRGVSRPGDATMPRFTGGVDAR